MMLLTLNLTLMAQVINRGNSDESRMIAVGTSESL